MRKLWFAPIGLLILTLFSGLGYAEMSGEQFVIKGPEMVKSIPYQETGKTDDEICIVGHGADLGREPDKQKAFVAAFCDALRNIIQFQKGVETKSTVQRVDNIQTSVIDISCRGRIGNFEITGITTMKDITLLEDKIIVKYNNLTITVINSVLDSPAIEKINFISLGKMPQEIGGIEITNAIFNSNGLCEVQLSCKDKTR